MVSAIEHPLLTVLISAVLLLSCVAWSMLFRVYIQMYVSLRTGENTLTNILAELGRLHVSIDGRFSVLHEQLLQAQKINLTLRERLAVAEERDLAAQRSAVPLVPAVPSPVPAAPLVPGVPPAEMP